MLSDEFTAVAAVRNSQELAELVLRFAHRLEFERMTAIAVIDHHDRETEFRSVKNVPAAFREVYDNPAVGRADPVMQHCKFSGLPIVWDKQTYVAAGCGEKWEMQAPHGYATGIALALHLPRGRHFFIGLDRDQYLPRNASQVTRMVADLHLFTAMAHEAGFRALFPDCHPAAIIRALTPRELECLRWTMEGKTAWEVSRILGIGEQTAVRHLNNATHKLGCINKYQAVLKAFRLSLIH